MKRLLAFGVLSLAACSSVPQIDGYAGPKALPQDVVVTRSRLCTSNSMKPIIVYLPQKTDFGNVSVPIDVHCDPYR